LKYIFPSDLDMYINNGWIKGNPKNESWQKNQSESRKNFYKIELNNTEIIVKGKDSIFSYLKENYNCVISGTEVKHLIRTGKEFIAHHSKHKILKGLKISRVEKR
ncbi:MAG: hypothetical protein IJH34_15025, partial [Romboutsia sp.]|nr:hypothetical protein [Romboutsia sp.]